MVQHRLIFAAYGLAEYHASTRKALVVYLAFSVAHNAKRSLRSRSRLLRPQARFMANLTVANLWLAEQWPATNRMLSLPGSDIAFMHLLTARTSQPTTLVYSVLCAAFETSLCEHPFAWGS